MIERETLNREIAAFEVVDQRGPYSFQANTAFSGSIHQKANSQPMRRFPPIRAPSTSEERIKYTDADYLINILTRLNYSAGDLVRECNRFECELREELRIIKDRKEEI